MTVDEFFKDLRVQFENSPFGDEEIDRFEITDKGHVEIYLKNGVVAYVYINKARLQGDAQ